MCCFADFVVKYVLILTNIVFALAGIVIVGLGVAVHIQLKEIRELIPVNLTAISIGIIVVGCLVFVISFCACCGAIMESRFMLIVYALFMIILAAAKIYLAVVIFNFLDDTMATVARWLNSAFKNNNLRPAYHVMEHLFSCCGTTGASSYLVLGDDIPSTCCGNPEDINCTPQESYSGCTTQVGNYFETFGGAIGGVLIVVIIIELVCVLFGTFMSCRIRRPKYMSA